MPSNITLIKMTLVKRVKIQKMISAACLEKHLRMILLKNVQDSGAGFNE